MGKKKSFQKKKQVADQVRSRKDTKTVKTNPFEIKFNRQKQQILGRKLPKQSKGKPGVSRNKAIQKRKETLLVEYERRHKSGGIRDLRIGESDPSMSAEEKMLQRYAVEKQKSYEKTNKFNLGDDDDDDEEEGDQLTHYGQSLSEIEKFDAPQAESDDEEDRGQIGADIVGEQHFGGFASEKDMDVEEAKEHKTWKERMEDLITKTRKERYEKQREKAATVEMTDRLNQEWKESGMQLIANMKMRKDAPHAKGTKDDYDIAVRELMFEMKAQPTDRLKSEEELAKEAKERLEKLEADRKRRMLGLSEEKDKEPTHVSADDLDDGFIFEKIEKKGVSFKDGKMVVDGEEESEGEDEEDEEEGEEDEGDDGEEDSESAEEEADEEDEDEDAMGRTSDLESSGDEDEEEPKALKSPVKVQKDKAAEMELPYTFKAPESYEELLALFQGRTDQEVLTIVERTRKCHHPSLAEGNKEKLKTLCELLLQFYCDLALQSPPKTILMNGLVAHLYDMTQQFPAECAEVIKDMLVARQLDLSEELEGRNGRAAFPNLDTLLLLKLISLLFPTSDLRHPVTTPAMLYMAQVLTKCPVKNIQDVYFGLFVCNLFLEYVFLSKRFVPEAINFLRGVLFLACDPTIGTKGDHAVIAPFKPVGKTCGMLILQQSTLKDFSPTPLSVAKVLGASPPSQLQTDQHRASCLHLCLRLIQKFVDLYKELPAFQEIFLPLKYFCQQVQTTKFPKKIQEVHQEVLKAITVSPMPRQWLVRKKLKPVISKLYEPRLEEHFDGKKKRGGTKKTQEEQRLQMRYKRELKGAVRDIRKDSQFLARHRLKEQMTRDTENKMKLKRIYSQLAQQEGEVKSLQRKKSRPL